LIEQSLRTAPSLATALARIRQAEARAQAAGAGNRPSFALDASEQRVRLSEHDIIPPPYGGSAVWRGGVTAGLSWDLDFFGRQAALIREAKLERDAAALDAEGARLAIAGSLAQAYLQLDRAYRLLDIARQTEEQRQDILDITRSRVQAGLAPRPEQRQAEAALPAARMQRLQAQAESEIAMHRIAALIGLGADSYPQFTRPQLNLDTALPLPESLPADLLARRPDVLASRARVDGALAGRKAAKAAFYPDINLSALAGFQAIGLGNLFDWGSRQYGAGPAIHLPLFDSVRLKAGYRGATAELDAAIASYNETVLQAVRQAADQLSLISSLKQQLVESQVQLDAAQDAYKLTEERYKAGLSGYLPVLTTEGAVLQARQAQADILAAYATARVTLLLSLGGSFVPPKSLVASTNAGGPQ
jgi:NodT family efflux transporter outer membrane factor (OMF) lipoprotein